MSNKAPAGRHVCRQGVENVMGNPGGVTCDFETSG
jgi:hypothetical protein